MAATPESPSPAAAVEVVPPPRRPWRPVRIALRTVAVVIGIVIALFVSAFVGDLGPSLRARAEREGSRFISRPMHIGKLSVNLLRGRFVVEDLLIEGLAPSDRPFFRAGRIDVLLTWGALLNREVFIDRVTISDWHMVVETFPGDRHNFIRLPSRRGGPSRFVTTVQLVRAERGEFVYEDHGVPWSTIARNLDVTIAKTPEYRGSARFTGGTVQIQNFEPMWADMSCSFKIDKGQVLLDRIDLTTDGATSKVTGVVDLGKWPEQYYDVVSQVDFPRMRELFWAKEQFSLSGTGEFRGRFHLFKGGRDLTGRFTSPVAGLNAWRFPHLRGNLRWLPDRFEVTDASSDLYGGRARFSYSMKPLGKPGTPAVATLDTTYDQVDLAEFAAFMDRPGLRLRGRASGRNVMEWPLGRWRDRSGKGHVTGAAPGDVALMVAELTSPARSDVQPRPGPFNNEPFFEPLAVGGEIAYRFDGEHLDIAPSTFRTPGSYVTFEGRTAWAGESSIAFHVTSRDWQESDRVLAGIIKAVTGSARAVPIGGWGTFDGKMTGNFRSPRVEGRFVGGGMRAWDVTWGSGQANVVIENGYVDVTKGVITNDDGGRFDIEGRFAAGYPRRDGGEEINARVTASRWTVVDLRHAFGLDDYNITGRLSGEFHLIDRYERPHGFGRLVLEDATTNGESFERATAGLRFEGNGVRLDAIDVVKGQGTVTGAAFVGWDGTYSFNVDGRGVSLESVDALAMPETPLSGQMQFSASGSGAFESPRYEFRARVEDLYVKDEGIGLLTGRLTVRDRQLTIDQFEVASPRLAVSGGGRVALTPESDAELTFRFSDASLDPYVRVFEPGLSPYTTVVASGTLRLVGELRNRDRLRAEAVVEEVTLRLLDYSVRNDGPVRLMLEKQDVTVERLRLVGEGTQIEVAGNVRLDQSRVDLRALGDANLSLLQGFLPDVRSAGAAELSAVIQGTIEDPAIVGSLEVFNGRLRYFPLPHAVEALNGRVEFDANGLRLDGLTGRLGGGAVRFGGRVGFRRFSPVEYGITAAGEEMRLRYPEGFRSTIDADLALRGPVAAPVLTGTVDVQDSAWDGTVGSGGNAFLELTPGTAREGPATPAVEATAESKLALRFDVRINAPSSLRIENRSARLTSSADLLLGGTSTRPLLFGRIEIEQGEVLFEGNRYQVTRGSVDFSNPTKIEPFFDVEAETQARVPGQTYRVTFHASGTPDRFGFGLTSDPPLATVDILALLFGDARDPQNADIRALRTPNLTEQDLLAARATRLLASPLSNEVGRVVEETFGVDTVQIAPSLGEFTAQETLRLNPSARLTIGKRISDKLFLTYARALSTSTGDQIILLEYNQTDRFSWVMSQNEDRTYAIDVRVKHVF